MKLISLLYVSKSAIALGEELNSVNEMVAIARVRNAEMGITGALLFTGEYFAQVLEGAEASIDTLMDSICRDPRHKDVQIIERSPISKRQFSNWALVFSGPSQFVSSHVMWLLSDSSRSNTAEWMHDLMREFSADSGEGDRHGG